MARTVIYNGPTVNLGRFGKVKNGQELLLQEREWYMCRNDASFTLKSHVNGEHRISPRPTPLFDFTRLKWGTGQIFREVHRKGRKQLKAMATAFESLGLPCALSDDMGRDGMADAVLETAALAGWLPE